MRASARFRALFLVVCTCILPALTASAQFPAQCDARKECIFNAVQTTVSSGRGAHFIEVSNQPIRPRQTALTVEMWVKTDAQAGKRIFLGGLWGPNRDANDVWVLYIDENNQLTFEVNADGSMQGQADNTIVRAPASSLFGRWAHVAAIFDGASQSVRLYIDGRPAAGPVTNPAFPVSNLKPLSRPDLTTQFGSCNAIADNENLYRTFRGMIDEIRVWERALTDQEVLCQKDRSLNGNEAGLRLYYRCNEAVDNVVQICDATGNGFSGLLRAGAKNVRSDRTAPRTLVVTPSTITDELRCDSTKSWTFTITDTSICGSTATVRMRGPEAGMFTVAPTNLTLVPGQPVTVTVTYSGTTIGPFVDTLEIRPTNRCGLPNTFVKLDLKRTTQVGISRSSVLFDTLFVGCRDKTFIDSTVTICNTSDVLGQPAPLTIQSATTRDPQAFRVISPTLPLTLAPGQCTTLVVRSFVMDTTNDYRDTLVVRTSDVCQRAPLVIALTGRTQEVILLQNSGGGRLPDTLRFNPTCPGQLSSPRYYTWQNITLTPIDIDTIILPKDFTHYRVNYPFRLNPRTGYPPLAIRFRPRNPGVVFDSVVIRTRIQGCTIERVFYVTGRGLDNKVEWSVKNVVDFGNVIVGQQRTINIVARNTSQFDTLNVSLYVERGEAFTLLAGTGRRIPPGDSTSIPVTFRPIDSLEYIDRLCLFETRCYTVDCIPLRGKGVLETFRFQPLVMETQNVIACRERNDSVYIVNMTNVDQTITNVNFVNPSGRFIAVSPTTYPISSLTIRRGDSAKFVVTYRPNDVTQDRADRAFLQYKSADNKDWQVQLIGTSATPRVFVTSYTAFGTVEVGDRRVQTLVVENTSSLPMLIDSLTIGNGFTILSTSRALPLTLQPRDSIAVEVEFAPTAATSYNAELTAWSSAPCVVRGSGDLNGKGVIIRLQNALSLVNFGFVRPCECADRVVELVNASLVFDMTIDSLLIDATGIPGGKPQFFTWTSKYSPTGTFPYAIPPNSRDTITIRFCPNTPAEDSLVDVRAALRIRARGSQWTADLETFLSGKRSMTFKPGPILVQFPPGPIDTVSQAPRTVTIRIPNFIQNPSQDVVVIDSVTFEPNERVFFIEQPTTWPQTVRPGDSLQININQRPRAPRDYVARMVIHYSKPCVGKDTTVLVRGAGYAQAKGLMFTFDPARQTIDTFAMVSCDTLEVPVRSSIVIDASVVDIDLRVDFDTTQLRLLDVVSPLLSGTCTSATGGLTFTPSFTIAPSPYGGYALQLKNVCGIDSLTPFVYLRFVTVANNRADSPITIDSINFDTEDVILYRLVATGDEGRILALKSEITIPSAVAFDSVRILDCLERTVTVFNTGDVANTVDMLLDLPTYTTVVGSIPPAGDSIQPGDSAVVTLRFCPRTERSIDTSVIGVSSSPCDTRDTTTVTGYGYAPELPLSMAVLKSFYVVTDTLGGAIGDTITMSVFLEKDISATYGGVTYWLNGLSFDVDLQYNGRALKYIDAPSLSESATTAVNVAPGSIRLETRGADTVRAGEFAQMRFLVTVPDTADNMMNVTTGAFTTDSLAFLDVVPSGLATPFVITGTCNITVVKFTSVGAPTVTLRPNPVVDDAELSFRIQETVPATAVLVNQHGAVVRSVLDGSLTLSGGEYSVRFTTSDLPSGVYHLRFQAGVVDSVIPFVIVK